MANDSSTNTDTKLAIFCQEQIEEKITFFTHRYSSTNGSSPMYTEKTQTKQVGGETIFTSITTIHIVVVALHWDDILQEAKDPLHHPAAEQPREEVQGEAVLVHRREGRVFSSAEAHGDTGELWFNSEQEKIISWHWFPGENLVPEQASENETFAGVGTWEASFRDGSDVAAAFWDPSIPPPRTSGKLSTSPNVSCFSDQS